MTHIPIRIIMSLIVVGTSLVACDAYQNHMGWVFALIFLPIAWFGEIGD